MCFRIVITVSLLCSSFFSCARKEEDIMHVEKTSYTIEDEALEDRSFKVLRYAPKNDSTHYSGYFVTNEKYDPDVKTTNIHLMDDEKNSQYFISIYSYGDLKYQTYQTTGTYPVSANRVFVKFRENIEYGYTTDLMESEYQSTGYEFKYEKLNSEYELITFDFGAVDSDLNFRGRFIGRFKIKI